MSNYEERIADLERSLADCRSEIASLRSSRLARRVLLVAAPLAILGWCVVQTGAQTPASSPVPKPAEPVATAADAGKIVQASRFEVVDKGGKVLATLGAAGDTGELAIMNADGKAVAKLGPHRNGTGDGTLTTFSRGGDVLVHIASTGKKDGVISTYNHDGQELIMLGVNEKGSGAILTSNANGLPMTLLTGMPEGGYIGTYNDSNHVVVKIGVKDQGAGIIEVIGADGNVAEIDPTDWPEKE